ncbi:MAG: cell division protein ZapA [Pseudomonadota bacterium]|jgi:cell division protein ZapA
MQTLDIKILDREFRVACTEEDRPGLQEAVEYLDKKMRDIRDSGKVVTAERIAIMAALNMAHELLSTRMAGGFDIGEYKRRIGTMQAAIDAALAEQEKLF